MRCELYHKSDFRITYLTETNRIANETKIFSPVLPSVVRTYEAFKYLGRPFLLSVPFAGSGLKIEMNAANRHSLPYGDLDFVAPGRTDENGRECQYKAGVLPLVLSLACRKQLVHLSVLGQLYISRIVSLAALGRYDV